MLRSETIARMLTEGREDKSTDPLVIAPFDDEDLHNLERKGSSSVDLRLGSWFAILRHARVQCLTIDDPPSEARLAKSVYVPFGSEFVLHPRNFVLGTTIEWLRLPKDIAGSVIGRSSWGRRGLIIATASGIHPGFTGCLTLELANVGEIPISVKPGMQICQMSLFRTEGTKSEHVDESGFVGQRKPQLGRISLDSTAQFLADAYKDVPVP